MIRWIGGQLVYEVVRPAQLPTMGADLMVDRREIRCGGIT